MFKIKNITKKFSSNKVLDDFTVNLEDNKIIGLLGPNGARKTTLFKCILDLYNYEGEIVFNKEKDYKNLTKKYVAGMAGMPAFYENLTVEKNLEIANLYTNIEKKAMADLIKTVGVDEFLDKKPKECSLGMRQRLAIAMLLIRDTDLILLDEPMNGLDPEGIKDLREILKELCHKNKKTILVSSHILSEIANLCDEVILMDKGRFLDKLEPGDDLEDKYMKIIKENR